MLIGHLAQRAAFLDAWTRGRLHHAWLLAGPQGVGKRAFADAAALTVLAGAADLNVDPADPAARLVAAGSHPDHLVVERGPLKSGGTAKEIVIHQVRGGDPPDSHAPVERRDLVRMTRATPSISAWRVVIIDPAESMNLPAANALLKSLEEPPARTLFLIVSHAPGRLLATIRSRCRRLRFAPLDPADTRAVLAANLPETAETELATLTALAEGAPGRALRYAGLAVGGLQDALDQLSHATPAQARQRGLDLARALAAKSAQPRYEAFLDLASRHLARAAARRTGDRLAAALALWESARDLAAEAIPGALDPAAVTAELARLVAQLGPEHA